MRKHSSVVVFINHEFLSFVDSDLCSFIIIFNLFLFFIEWMDTKCPPSTYGRCLTVGVGM